MAAISFRSSVVRSRWLYVSGSSVPRLYPGESIACPALHRFSRHLRGVGKRSGNRVRVELGHLVEIREMVRKDEVEGQVMRERRHIRRNALRRAHPCFLELRMKFGPRHLEGALDQLFPTALADGMSRRHKRDKRGYRGANDDAARAREGDGSGGLHGGSPRFEKAGVRTANSKRGANSHFLREGV